MVVDGNICSDYLLYSVTHCTVTINVRGEERTQGGKARVVLNKACRELPAHSLGLAEALLRVAAAQRLAAGIRHLLFGLGSRSHIAGCRRERILVLISIL